MKKFHSRVVLLTWLSLVAIVGTWANVAVAEESHGLSSISTTESWVRRKLSQYYTSLNGYKVFDSYPTNWDNVEASPQARTVQVNDIGACFCDLTSNACDPNCCCDTECTDQDKALFTGCLPEKPNNPSLTYCLPKSIVQSVNLKSSGSLAVVYKTTPKKDFFSELLCVEKDNNPAFGNFFMDPGVGSSDKLTEVLSRNPGATYETSVASSQETVAYTSNFKANETIPIAYSSATVNGSLTVPKHAALALPVAIFGEDCMEVELVGFLQNVPQDAKETSKTCLQVSRSDDCETNPYFDPTYYVGSLQVATTPTRSSYVNVTVTGVSVLDASTGEITSAGSTTLPGTTFVAGTATTEPTCQNVLQSLKYTIKHNGNGVITAVNAEIILTTVTMTMMPLQSSTALAYGLAYTQAFKVDFEKDGATDTIRGKSGNPGYRSRYPVLFGVETVDAGTQKAAVSQFTAGLPMISGNEQGVCSAQKTSPLPFGSQSMSSCKMVFNLEQLQKFCTKDSTTFASVTIPATCPYPQVSNTFDQTSGDANTPLPILLLSGLFGSSTMSGTYAGNKPYVGIWGDADPTNTADWLEVQVESIDDGMSWNDQENTCSNVITGVEYEFLTGNVGSQVNAQQKITYVRVKFTYDDWTFHSAQEDCPQSFNVYSSSSFVAMEQEVDSNVKPPAPPVFPKLPEDAFYPFLTN